MPGISTPRAGSRKAEVYEQFVAHGPEKAMEHGLKLELAKGTLTSWFATWTRAASAPPPKDKRGEAVPPGAYQAMICHYEAIARFKRKNPHVKHLPDELSELEDELVELCEARGWTYPGKIDQGSYDYATDRGRLDDC